MGPASDRDYLSCAVTVGETAGGVGDADVAVGGAVVVAVAVAVAALVHHTYSVQVPEKTCAQIQ